MVAESIFEEPNLSYVRVNQSTSPGTGGSIKCNITKNMAPSDRSIVNSNLLPKSMVEQPATPQVATTILWKPDHLYSSEEKSQNPHMHDSWEQLPSLKLVQSSDNSKKRPLESNCSETDQPATKKSKSDTNEELRMKCKKLEEQLRNERRRNTDLQQKLQSVAKVISDPKKLKYLQMKLLSANRSSEGKILANQTSSVSA